MSRCFPFPPTGYTRNGSCSVALIESMKLRGEDEKKSKKEKRREKKEKRKEMKRIASHSAEVKEPKLIELEKIKLEKSSACLQKVDYCKNEQLETSDITEEHDRPVSWSEPCCSDSIQSSNKRKRRVSPSSHNRGTGIKIRFSLKKQREPEEYKLDDHMGSTSKNIASADSSAQDTNGSHHQIRCATNAERDQCVGNTDLQSSRRGASSNRNSLDDSLRVDAGHQSLFQNWVPAPLTCDGYLSEDQDWLFGSELKEERSVSKKAKPITVALRCSSPSIWPRAQYLPEVEVYALPYAVPF